MLNYIKDVMKYANWLVESNNASTRYYDESWLKHNFLEEFETYLMT
jgi:hypothetical protein